MLELPGSPEHRLQVADIHLHDADLGEGARGQQSRADRFRFAPVPAGQTQVQLVVLLQQPLAEGEANAAGGQFGHEYVLIQAVPQRPFPPVQRADLVNVSSDEGPGRGEKTQKL